MAESTLSLGYDDFRSEVGLFLGFGADPADWDNGADALIESCVQSGLRQFYHPPPLEAGKSSHQWSFLRPVTSLSTVVSYSSGTIAINNGETTVTLTDGVWPAWSATRGTLLIDDEEYEIASRDSDTELTLSSAWDGDSITDAEYTLEHSGDYDLPDDFGAVDGDFTFAPSEGSPSIRIVGEGQIRAYRQHNAGRSRPRYAAIRPKASDGTSGQRFEVLFAPTPDIEYVLQYRYTVLLNKLTADNPYPVGGMTHAETILASCLAVAEQRGDDEKGIRWERFIERLTASISMDQKAGTPDYFGYNGDNSDASQKYPVSRTDLVIYGGSG
jgi:hypothetical protein